MEDFNVDNYLSQTLSIDDKQLMLNVLMLEVSVWKILMLIIPVTIFPDPDHKQQAGLRGPSFVQRSVGGER